MLTILNNYMHGYIAIPVILACKKHGLFMWPLKIFGKSSHYFWQKLHWLLELFLSIIVHDVTINNLLHPYNPEVFLKTHNPAL